MILKSAMDNGRIRKEVLTSEGVLTDSGSSRVATATRTPKRKTVRTASTVRMKAAVEKKTAGNKLQKRRKSRLLLATLTGGTGLSGRAKEGKAWWRPHGRIDDQLPPTIALEPTRLKLASEQQEAALQQSKNRRPGGLRNKPSNNEERSETGSETPEPQAAPPGT